ncbi:Fic/DOC family protein, partial [Frankia sp. CcWB2]
MSDPYCWPGTECLRNRLDIHDPDELADIEQQISGLRYAELGASLLPGAYDTEHLRRFHRMLFQDIYRWAGEIRTVNLAKDGHPFCRALFVEGQLYDLFSGLAEDRHLVGLKRESFVLRFAT